MNPFEKRDKIARTPPGISFYERSSVILDRTVNADFSVYDETGMRVLVDPPPDLKRFTLTFDNDGIGGAKVSLSIPSEGRVSLMDFDRRFPHVNSMQNVRSHQLCTSSPVANKQPVSPERAPDPTATPATVLAKRPRTVVAEKENIKPDISNDSPYPIKSPGGQQLSLNQPAQREGISTDSSFLPSQQTSSSSPPVTVRRLRSRNVTIEESNVTDSGAISTRGKRKRAAAAANNSSKDTSSASSTSSMSDTSQKSHASSQPQRTTRKRRAIAKSGSDQMSSALSFEAVTPHRNPEQTSLDETPVTVVAKLRGRRAGHLTTVTEQQFTVPDQPVTVRRRVTASHRDRGGTSRLRCATTTADQSTLSGVEDSIQMDSMLEPKSRTFRRAHPPAVHSVSSSALSTLDISAITPAPTRRPPRVSRVAMDTTVLSQDEPIAARLRRNCCQISYMEPKVTRRRR